MIRNVFTQSLPVLADPGQHAFVLSNLIWKFSAAVTLQLTPTLEITQHAPESFPF